MLRLFTSLAELVSVVAVFALAARYSFLSSSPPRAWCRVWLAVSSSGVAEVKGDGSYIVLSYWNLCLRLGGKGSYFGVASSFSFELDDCEILAVLVIVADLLG